MPVTCQIANAAGFLGDNLDAPRRLVEAAEVDYLTLEYLAELTLSILARQRQKNPQSGYAADFLTVLESIAPSIARQSQLRVVTNAGGINPASCGLEAAKILDCHGLDHVVIGVVSGDDLLQALPALQQAGCPFDNLDTGRPLAELGRPIVSANAYFGARPIAAALSQGARMVVTGRVADASLTLGPAAHEFGWRWDDWTTLAGGSVAGHLIECGAQVTGGLYRHWQRLDLAQVGYPIAEVERDGSCTITKPRQTGGLVSRATVVEQLVYEIGDPAHYLTPDVDVDFTTIEVAQTGDQRVAVRGATGRPAPANYKVSLAYHAGYSASGQLLVFGRDAVDKADACAQMIQRRLGQAGVTLDQFHVEYLGAGDSVPRAAATAPSGGEVLLRIAVRDERAEAVERFVKEFAPLITSGPPGLAGYAAPRGPVRPVYAYWPTLVPKELVEPRVKVRTVREWLQHVD